MTLAAHSLARCSRCRRILPARCLYKGACKRGGDCAAAALIAVALAGEEEDRMEFVAGIERGMANSHSIID